MNINTKLSSVAVTAALLSVGAMGAAPGTTRDQGLDENRPLNFKVHFIPRAKEAPVIDGKFDEPAWAEADAITDYSHCAMSVYPAAPLRVVPTAVKYLWDDKYLYIAAKCHEDTPENMERYHKSISNKADLIHARDVIEMHVDGKNDEWTKHTLWLSGSGEREGIWEYDFGWGLLTDSSWGVSADWIEAVSEGKDEKGDYWAVEARIALADLEIQPRIGYIFGMEPTRFRFDKVWYTAADGKDARTLSEALPRGVNHINIYGWGTQGVWHKQIDRFGKCILVDKKPTDLISGLKIAFPDLDKRTIRIRGNDGYLAIQGGKTFNETYFAKCNSLLAEARESLKKLDPILSITDTKFPGPINAAKAFVTKTTNEIQIAENELKAAGSADAARLDKLEKSIAKWTVAVESTYYKTVCDMLVREQFVRFPVQLDPGEKAPDFSQVPKYTPKMSDWKDPTLVSWGKPAAAGRKKVLVSVYYGDTFAVQHLMNRLDVDCDILEVRYNQFRQTPQELEKTGMLENALARNKYDGFVFIGANPVAWPDRLRCKLAELQLEGTPVTLVNGSSWGNNFKVIKDFELGAPGEFDKLVSDNEAFRTGRPESVTSGPSPYALHWETEELKAPLEGSFGKGRVLSYATAHPESATYVTHPVFSPSFSVTPDKTFQDEYALAYSCRVVMEGLGMRGPATLKKVEEGKAVVVAPGDWKGQVKISFRDNWGHEAAPSIVKDVDAKEGENEIAFDMPAFEPGDYSVDAILLDGGKSCDFAAKFVKVTLGPNAPAVAAVTPVKECFEKDEDVKAEVKVASPREGLTVTAELRDPRYRIIARGDFAVNPATGTATVTFPANRMRLNCHFIDATLKDKDGKKVSSGIGWFFRRIGDLDDFRVFDQTSSAGGKDVEPRLAILSWHGMDLLQTGTRTRLFYGTDPVCRNRIPGQFSNWQGAINSPAWKKWLHDTYTKQAIDLKTRNGRFLSLGDDSGCPLVFVEGKADWVGPYYVRLRKRLNNAAKERNVKNEVVYREWLDMHGFKDARSSFDFYWGLQKYAEKGMGLKKLITSELNEDEVADIREACREAYGDIRIFNVANEVNLKSFENIDATTIPTFKPMEKAEYPYFLFWLEKRYEGDIAKLNAAWGANESSFTGIKENTIGELKRLGHWTCELDKQKFLEDSFLENCRIIGEAVKAVDPTIAVGFGASSLNNCIMDVFKYLDTVVPYGGREDMELIRSRKHAYIGETIGWYGTSFGSDEEMVPQPVRSRQSWHSLLTGANFCWMWTTCYGLSGARTVSPSGFGWSFEAHREIKRGPGSLLLRSTREADGIRILFSRDSGRMASVKKEPTSHLVARRAWNHTIEALGLQYVHVTNDDILEDTLVKDGVKVLILPMCDVIDSPTAAKITEFVKNGGTVIADFMPGLYDANGNKLEKGTLDALFVEEKEHALVLNQDLSIFAAQVGRAEALKPRADFLALFAKAGVEPQIKVVHEDGTPVQGVEITRFTRDGQYCFSIEKKVFANEVFPMKAFVELPEAGSVYDVRAGKFVASGKRFEIALQGEDVRLFSVQKEKVGKMALKLNNAKFGGTLEIDATLKGGTGTRVFRVEFVPPEGFPRTDFPPIQRYVEDAPNGHLTLSVPLAFNERRDLVVEVTDVATGTSASVPLKLK